MPSLPVLVAVGPCLIMVMAAIALLIVHHRLSPVRHALVWAAAFALAALQWSMVAVALGSRSIAEAESLWVDLAGISALILFAEGFRLRATGQRAGNRLRACGAALLVMTVVAWIWLPPVDARAALSLFAAGLLALAAWRVAPSGRRRRTSEIAVTTLLVVLALIRLIVAGAALFDRGGIAVLLMQQATALPVAVGETLFAMLLIASDFSAERHRLVHTDPLTGVLNRAGFEQAARDAMARARPPSRPVTLALADIDRFKAINDVHGHVVGDRTLGRVAGHLRASAGEHDVVGRIGGEEFAVLLWDQTGDTALQLIERVRAAMPDMCRDAAVRQTVTASFGVAEQRRGEDFASLFQRADRALYRSKNEGRNRATLAGVFG